MKVKIKEEIKSTIQEYYSIQPEVVEFMEMIKKLNDGKWVDKNIMIQTMINYVLFNESSINELGKGLLLAQVNYEAISEVQKQYKVYYENVIEAAIDTNELLTEIGVKI